MTARPDQLTPPGEWDVFLCLGGRGSGKTRTGAEDISDYCRTHPDSRVALVAPTFEDGRDFMVEGDSGLLAVLPPMALLGGSRDEAWNRSLGELWLSNGCYLKIRTAEKPARLRGPQWHRAWVDEPGTFPDAHLVDEDTGEPSLDTTWSNLSLSLRLGDSPRAVVTGTPRPVGLIRYLVNSPTTVIHRSRMADNTKYLAPGFVDKMTKRYGGTRLGRQELDAELLEDVEGALWSLALINPYRVKDAPDLARVVIGVDPAGSTTGAETGIVAAGVGYDERYYVLADHTLRGSPAQWAAATARAYDVHEASRVVAERNFGGDMVASTLATERSTLPVRMVNASRGKAIRAEPIAALYEQGRVSHLAGLSVLEDQMLGWVPGRPGPSPDRIDALVWALSDLVKHGPRTVAMAPPARIAHRILN